MDPAKFRKNERWGSMDCLVADRNGLSAAKKRFRLGFGPFFFYV